MEEATPNRTPDWGLRDALEDDVWRALREWNFSDTPPPWSDAELFTICVLIVRPSSLGRMRNWLKGQFPWCSNGARSIHFVQSQHWAIKMTHEAPVHHFRDFEADDRQNSMCFELVGPVRTTRLFLQNVLRLSSYHVSPSRRNIFSTIPAELRLMILEEVLVVPQSQVFVHFEHRNGWTMVNTLRRKCKNALAKFKPLVYDWIQPESKYECFQRQSTDVLAVLATSKQIYEEAMPIFFGKNIFTCRDIGMLDKLLRKTSPARRDCIRHVVFKYYQESFDMRFAPGCFKIMKGMENLRRLDIKLRDLVPRSYFRYATLQAVIANPLKLPGLRILTSLRIQEINVHGDCLKLKAHLAHMIKVNADKEAKKSTRKRKVKDAPPKARKKSKQIQE